MSLTPKTPVEEIVETEEELFSDTSRFQDWDEDTVLIVPGPVDDEEKPTSEDVGRD